MRPSSPGQSDRQLAGLFVSFIAPFDYCYIPCQFDFCNLMGLCIARNHKPRTVAMFMVQKLPVLASGVVSQIKIFIELRRSVFVLPIRSVNKRCIAQINKFCGVAWSKKRVIDNHDWDTPLMQIGLRAHSLFVNQMSAFKTVEQKLGSNRVGAIFG